MDLSKIFLKDACPTKMGGQAVMEGIMMKGEKKTALAVRLPNDDIQIKTVPTKVYGKWTKIPLLRGVVAFIDSMVTGTKTLMDSAEMLEDGDEEEYEESRFEAWLNRKFGAKGAWNLMIFTITSFISLTPIPYDPVSLPDRSCRNDISCSRTGTAAPPVRLLR